MSRMKCHIQPRNLYRLSAAGRYTPKSAVNVGRVKDRFAAPSTSSSIVGGSKDERRTTSEIDSFQLPIREKSNGLSVRGPEWKFPVFGSWERLCFRLIHRPQEQHRLAFGCAHENHLACIRRDRRR